MGLKYFVKLHDGSKYEVDKLDFNHITHRISTGRTNGFYIMRGTKNANLSFAFKYFMTLETTGEDKPKDKSVRNINTEKLAPVLVGKPAISSTGCTHDWNNEDDWIYVHKNFGGKIQYRKQCKTCGKVSSLIKPQQVKLYMEHNGQTLDEVKENTTPKGQLPK